jgi:hypothetical protein
MAPLNRNRGLRDPGKMGKPACSIHPFGVAAREMLSVRSFLISANWPVLIFIISFAGNGSVAGWGQAKHLWRAVHLHGGCCPREIGPAAGCVYPRVLKRSRPIVRAAALLARRCY